MIPFGTLVRAVLLAGALCGAVLVVSHFVVEPELGRLELSEAASALRVADAAVRAELAELDTIARDWASRKRVIDLVARAAQPEREPGLPPAWLATWTVDFAVLYDPKAHVQWSAAATPAGDLARVPEPLLMRFASVPDLSRPREAHAGTSGYLAFEGGVLMVSSCALRAPEMQHGVGGAVVLARFLEPDRFAGVAQASGLGIRLHPGLVREAPGQQLAECSVGNRTFHLDDRQPDRTRGTARVIGFDRAVAATLDVDFPRRIRARADETRALLMIAALCMALLAALTHAVVVWTLCTSRLRRLRHDTEAITVSEAEEPRGVGKKHGDDEVGALARAIDAMSAQLVGSMRHALRADRDRTEFLATMSASIRTPMTSILGYSERLMQPALAGNEWEAQIDSIRRNGEKMLGVLDDILDLSKLEAGKVRAEQRPSSIHEVVAEVAENFRAAARARRIRFETPVHPDVPERTRTDPVLVGRILRTLCRGAIGRTDHGAVCLATSIRSGSTDGGTQGGRAAELLGSRAGKKQIVFRVSDTGPTIAADERAELFEPPRRVAARSGAVTDGLALPIARRLARVLGGDLELDPAAGRGNVFTLTLPITRSASLASADATRESGDQADPTAQKGSSRAATDSDLLAAGVDLSGLRVLLAEDGEDNQRLVSAILRQHGAEVAIANDGWAASEMILSTPSAPPFDLILMDLQMPVMDGLKATERLRAAGCMVPILALTALSEDEGRPRALAVGCDGFLKKPIDKGEMLRTLAGYAEARNAAADAE